jgi:hypothetical protein
VYDRETVYAILDEGWCATSASSFDGQPFVIPTGLLPHRRRCCTSTARPQSRMLTRSSDGVPGVRDA